MVSQTSSNTRAPSGKSETFYYKLGSWLRCLQYLQKHPHSPRKMGLRSICQHLQCHFFISAIAWATFGTICIKVGFTYFYFWRILEKRALTVHESNVSEQKGCVTAVAFVDLSWEHHEEDRSHHPHC